MNNVNLTLKTVINVIETHLRFDSTISQSGLGLSLVNKFAKKLDAARGRKSNFSIISKTLVILAEAGSPLNILKLSLQLSLQFLELSTQFFHFLLYKILENKFVEFFPNLIYEFISFRLFIFGLV